MRILAIRGKNIASLAGEFELDLVSAPLGSAGIFSLGGPTGAGKSTVLDAMCLALYGKTPRSDRAGVLEVPDSSGQGVTAQNPALLLRRGCFEGYAEAEFLGMDGVAYRARWTVKRARKSATGNLQVPDHGLFVQSTGQPLGGKRTETLALIEAKLGLDFSQFTRAVLLAQNEFAAFLTAKAADRAKLLETLTGTERFGVLSTRIYERAKAERDRLERMAIEAGTREPCGAEARALLETALQAAAADEESSARRAACFDAACAFRDRREVLAESLRAAEAAREQAELGWQAAERTKGEIERTLSVQIEARPLVDEAARCREVVAQAEAERAKAEELAGVAERARTEAQGAAERAEAQVTRLDDEDRQLRPVLEEARRLDTRLEEARRSEMQALRSRNEAGELHQTRKAAAERAATELARLDNLHKHDRAWLEDRGWLAPLARAWASKKEALRRAVRVQAELATARARAAKAESLVQRRGRELEALAKRAQAAVDDAKKLEDDSRLLSHLASADDLDQLETRERDASAALDAHLRIAEVLRDRARRMLSLAAKQSEVFSDRARVEWLRAQTATRRPELERASRDLEVARAEHRVLERMAHKTAETLRATLREGEACPVCGATEHPILRRAEEDLTARLREELERQTELVTRLEERRRDLEGENARDDQDLAALAERIDQGARAIDEAAAELARQREALRQAPGAGLVAEIEALGEAEREARLAAQQASLAASFAAAKEAREAAKAREKRAAEAGRRHADAQARVVKEHECRLTAERVFAESVRERDAAITDELRLAGELRREDEELSVSEEKAGWAARWEADPNAAAHWLTEQVEAWNHREQAASTCEQELVLLRARLPDLERERDESGRAADNRAEDHARAASRVESLQKQRLGLLEGKDASSVEKDLEERRKAATRAKEAATLRLRREQETAATVRATFLEKESAVRTARERQGESEERLAVWIAAALAGSAPRLQAREELSLLLGRDEAWRRQQEELVAQARTKRGQAQALAEQARSLSLEHARQEGAVVLALSRVVPAEEEPLALSLEPAWLTERRVSAAKAREAAREHRAKVLSDVQRDDEARTAFASVQESIERQRRAVERWGTLDLLLGSNNGNKLRALAQEVTLDLVLVHANLHLATLARRYRLERLPGGLDLVVVDREMLGEKRSVASLSGGETFLVSLALALGLASLSAEKVRVETLFIDEGFGSLDAHTLQIALEALYALQAEGRQIGIISHVGDLAERLGAEVRVEPMGHGRSRLRVVKGRSVPAGSRSARFQPTLLATPGMASTG